jgi:hypothetical protein
VGLVTGVLSLAREPLRLTLRAWELGLSSAADAARLGLELLDDRRPGSDDFAEFRAAGHPGNGGRPEPDRAGTTTVEGGAPAEPAVVVPETGYIAPEPGEVGPEPDVLDVEDAPPAAEAPTAGDAARAATDAPPPVPGELIPDHVDEEPVLVAEAAEAGAEDGAGAELHVDAPWDGYDRMTAAGIRDRLTSASAAEAGAVELYESTHKNRRSVMDAAARALRS